MRVLYVLWAYPVPSEEFIAREMRGLARMGVQLEVVVIGATKPTTPGASVYPARVVWLSELGSLALASACRALRSKPSLGWRLLAHGWRTWTGEGALGLARLSRMVLPALGLCDELRAQPPDVIHAHFLNAPAIFARLLAALLEKPWGASTHAHDLYAEGIDLRARLEGARYVLACSSRAAEDVRTYMGEEFRDRVWLVYHGVELDPGPGSMPDSMPTDRLIVAAGRFQPKKGFEILVDACAELSRAGFDCRCEIIGDGPSRAALARRIREQHLDARVRLVPWMQPADLRQRLSTASVLVVPSVVAADGDRDNIPNVLVEGLLLGTPLVASDLASIREVLAPEAAGLLVPPGSPSELAAAIRRLCEDPALAQTQRSSGRRLVRSTFDLRTTSARLQAILRTACATPGMDEPTELPCA